MVQSFEFTQRRVDQLKAPEQGWDWYKDKGCPGLQLAKFYTGTGTYYLVKRMKDAQGRSKPTRLKLGTTVALSVKAARDAARAKLGEIAKGDSPLAARQQQAGGATLAKLWGDYLELHARPRKRSWQDDERMYNKYLKPYHDSKLSAITPAVVAKWHGDVARKHGKVQANRALRCWRRCSARRARRWATPERTLAPG